MTLAETQQRGEQEHDSQSILLRVSAPLRETCLVII